jgi:hypothetical protein
MLRIALVDIDTFPVAQERSNGAIAPDLDQTEGLCFGMCFLRFVVVLLWDLAINPTLAADGG